MRKIGIIGAGNIGLALAQLLQKNKIVDENHLFISESKHSSTTNKLRDRNIQAIVCDNGTIFKNCAIVFLTIRPADFSTLIINSNSQYSFQLISSVAGVSFEKLKEKFSAANLSKIMPCGPELLLEEKGICALSTTSDEVEKLIQNIQIQPISVINEIGFDIFTTALCLPAIFLTRKSFPSEKESEQFILDYEKQLPSFRELYYWCQKSTPFDLSIDLQSEIIENMSTPGGITEKFVNEFKASNDLAKSFANALIYCQSFSK